MILFKKKIVRIVLALQLVIVGFGYRAHALEVKDLKGFLSTHLIDKKTNSALDKDLLSLVHYTFPNPTHKLSGIIKNLYDFGDEKSPLVTLIKTIFYQVPGTPILRISDGTKNNLAYYLNHITIGHIIGTLRKAKNAPKEDLEKSIQDVLKKDFLEIKSELEKNKKSAEEPAKNITKIVVLLKKVGINTNEKELTEKKYDEFLKQLEDKKTQEESEKQESIENKNNKKRKRSDDTSEEKPCNESSTKKLKKNNGNGTKACIDSTTIKEDIIKEDIIKAHNAITDISLTIEKARDNAKNAKGIYDAFCSLFSKELKSNNDGKIAVFAKNIVSALNVCGFWQKEEAHMPPFLAHQILLAFIFEKMETREQLKEYCLAVEKASNEKIWNFTDFNKNDVYTDTDYANYVKTLENTKSQGSLPLDQFLSTSIVQRYYSNKMPKNITYKSGVIFSCGDSKASFPDCMETAIRNTVNDVLFDIIKNLFSCEKYANIDTDIKTFYSAITPSTMEEKTKHDAWANIVSNRPFVIYHRVLNVKTGSVHEVGNTYAGCFHGMSTEEVETLGDMVKPVTIVDDHENFTAITIGDKTYLHVSQKAIQDKLYGLFELETFPENIIFLLDQLLGLNLFVGKNMYDEMKSSTFITTYFDELCKKLNWAFSDNLNKPDFKNRTSCSIKLKTNNDFEFSIELTTYHGYTQMPQEAPVKEYVQPISKNIYDSCKENLEQIFFLPVYNSTITDLDDIKNEKLTFISYVIFAQDIANDNVKRDIIEMILEMPELKENDQLFSLAIKLVDTLPYNEDLHYQLGILGTSHKEMNKKLSHIITEKIEKRLSELFYSDKTSIIMIRHIVSIYQTLFEKIDAYSDKAFQVAHNCFKRKNSDYDLKYQAIFLLAAIVEKGLKNDKDYDKFINLACNEFKYGTVNLFKALFNKGKGFEEAREVITLNQTMEYMLCERLEELRNSYLIVKTIN